MLESMLMTKVVPAGDWSDGPIAQMVKVASRGLRGNDRRAFVKRAGHSMLDSVDDLALDDEELIHVLAMGSTEIIGPNRNGDGFRAAELIKRAHTFVDHAKWYRNHANKPDSNGTPPASYGRVVKAAYHAPMGRVELLVALNREKSAARRNGGDFGHIADLELHKLASNRDIAVSMACVLPFDVCSGCQHAARRPENYCTESMCKRGGLRENITRVCEDGHVLHADNPDCTFFDISDVPRGADRIGFVTGLVKAAAWGGFSAHQADGYGMSAPGDLFAPAYVSDRARGAIKAAMKIASAEVDASGDSLSLAARFSPIGLAPCHDAAGVFSAFAREKIALPLADWLSLAGGDSDAAAYALPAVAARMPGVFCRLVSSRDFAEKAAEAASVVSGRPTVDADSYRRGHGLDGKSAMARISLAAIRGEDVPTLRPFAGAAEEGDAAEALAQKYAAYAAAVVAGIPDDRDDFALACALLARHNRVA